TIGEGLSPKLAFAPSTTAHNALVQIAPHLDLWIGRHQVIVMYIPGAKEREDFLFSQRQAGVAYVAVVFGQQPLERFEIAVYQGKPDLSVDLFQFLRHLIFRQDRDGVWLVSVFRGGTVRPL